MSMIGILLRVTNEQLESFLNNSSLLEEFIDTESLEESGSQLDIHKSWDAINFLLTGHSIDTIEIATPPLSQVIFSGQFIDEEQDMGYGPAHYLTPEQVREVSIALLSITSHEFRQRFNADKLNAKKVYPQSWEQNEDEKDFVTDNFENLKAFYLKATEERQAIVTYIT